MKRKLTLLMSLILVFSLNIACTKSHDNINDIYTNKELEVENLDENEGVQINYEIEDQEEIFGELSIDDIEDIIDDIFDKVSRTDLTKERIDLAIEEAFIENGITDETQIEAGKNKIIIK